MTSRRKATGGVPGARGGSSARWGVILLIAAGALQGVVAPGRAEAAGTRITVRVSVSSSGAEADDAGYGASVSADGRYVAFASAASNLVPGDANGRADSFVRDLAGGTTERVSVSSSGAEGDWGSGWPSISADGHYVAFESIASNLVPGDTNGQWDIFVRDRAAGTTERASISSSGEEGNWHSFRPSVSTDGRYVAFMSWAYNLVPGDTNGRWDIFVRDRAGGTTERVSVSSSGAQGNGNSSELSISANGRYVAFGSGASTLVPGDTNGGADIFVRDRAAGTTERVSVSSSGAEGDWGSGWPSVSADGRYVAFGSGASTLVPGDTNGYDDVFVRDRAANTTERVSVSSSGAEGDADSSEASISADGRFIAFSSYASNLAPGDTNSASDIFLTALPTQYFALGDGIASGAGLPGTTGPCQTSPASYPALLKTLLGDFTELVANLTCQGATASDLSSQADAALALRDTDLEALATISSGWEDLGLSTPLAQRQLLCDTPEDLIPAYAASRAQVVSDGIKAALGKLLADPKMVVVVTTLYSPFNSYPSYLDNPALVGGVHTQCDPEYPAWRSSHKARERAEYLVEEVNAAIVDAVKGFDATGTRVEVAPLSELLLGREAAQHPSGYCGSRDPSAVQTWIQYPAGGAASHTPTDCLFPSDVGALEIAKLIAELIPRPQAALDYSPPRSRVMAADGDLRLKNAGDVLRGRAVDDSFGLEEVEVVFSGPLGLIQQTRTVTPLDRACSVVRRSCLFSIELPDLPGVYTITSSAKDRAGNTESPGTGVTVVVV
ncbi:MAG: PD40 domain-containing protein [Acidobacteria bacterium]|nr:PD40 domain-containing protein [Acidobacteriota bacterium]